MKVTVDGLEKFSELEKQVNRTYPNKQASGKKSGKKIEQLCGTISNTLTCNWSPSKIQKREWGRKKEIS